MRHQQQEVVASLRAVLLVAAALAAVVPWRPSQAAGDGITANQGIGVGGSVSNSTINNTVNQENPATLAMLTKALSDKDVSEEHRREAEAKTAELATKLGFTKAAVTEFFKILGETDVPEEKIPARLVEIASHFAQTRDELAALAPDDAHAANLAGSAKSALDAGRLVEADNLLDQAKEAELAALGQAHELKQKAQAAEDRHALNAAKLLAGRGDIALTQLRYADAAAHFQKAVALIPSGYSAETADYLDRQAIALYREGDERGDGMALSRSVETLRLVLRYRTRDQVPLQSAATENNLGVALSTLQMSRTPRGGAGADYRAPMQEFPRDRVLLDWAYKPGTYLRAPGSLAKASLGEAVAAYRAALEEFTRDREPLQWAMTLNNLGAGTIFNE